MQPNASLPFVSVIIPLFNDWLRLELCLEALANQSYPSEKIEIIVVDNGSRDPGLAVKEKHPQVIWEVENKKSSYAARNKGLSVARGTIIAFTDSDCIPSAEWIKKGVSRLLDDPNCGIVAGHIEVFCKDLNHPTAVELYEYLFAFPQEMYANDSHFAATANAFTRRSVVDQVGGFDSSLQSSGDLEWGRRVYAQGLTVMYDRDALVKHPARYSLSELYRKTTRVARAETHFYDKTSRFLIDTVLWILYSFILIGRTFRKNSISDKITIKFQSKPVRQTSYYSGVGLKFHFACIRILQDYCAANALDLFSPFRTTCPFSNIK